MIVATHAVEISLRYSYFEPVRLLIKGKHGKILWDDFAAEVP